MEEVITRTSAKNERTQFFKHIVHDCLFFKDLCNRGRLAAVYVTRKALLAAVVKEVIDIDDVEAR
jgi:hypothetical protein